MKLEFNWKLKSYEYVSGSNSSKNWKSVPWLCSDFRSRNIRIPHLLRIQCISTWKVAFVQCQQSHSLAYSAIMLRGLVTSSEREREWLIWRDHPFGQSLGHDPFDGSGTVLSTQFHTWLGSIRGLFLKVKHTGIADIINNQLSGKSTPGAEWKPF